MVAQKIINRILGKDVSKNNNSGYGEWVKNGEKSIKVKLSDTNKIKELEDNGYAQYW
jgi:hypothetical protein